MPASKAAAPPEHACPSADDKPAAAGPRARETGPRRKKRALPIELVSAGMVARRVDVRPADVVYVKGILEASEGLGAVFAERGGELVVTAPYDREAELAELLQDLEREIGASVAAEATRTGLSSIEPLARRGR